MYQLYRLHLNMMGIFTSFVGLLIEKDFNIKNLNLMYFHLISRQVSGHSQTLTTGQ